MKDKIRFAVVGGGHIGCRHADLINRNEDCVLDSIVDIREDVRPVAARYNADFYGGLEEFLHSENNADVVVIATPNGLHFEQAMHCISHGKHIVLEKPMALNINEAKEIISHADNKGVKIFMVMQNRYSPPATWLKKVVESGVLGRILMLQINCFWNRDERYYIKNSWRGTKNLDGGSLFTQFSHFIDILYWIFGDISDVQSVMDNFTHQHLTDFEDTGIVTFRLSDGGLGSLNFTTSVWDSNLQSSLTVIAENGSIKIGGQYMDTVNYCHIKNYEMPEIAPTNGSNDYGCYKGSAANHHFVIENVVEVLNNNGEISVPAEDGRNVISIIERMYSCRLSSANTPK